MALNLVRAYDLRPARFRHDLWKLADNTSSDPFIKRLPLTLSIAGQYIAVMRRRASCNDALIDDIVQEAVTALQIHVLEIEAGTANHDGKLKYTVHNAVSRFIKHTFREPDPHAVLRDNGLIIPSDFWLDIDIVIPDARQRRVLNLFASGLTQAEIADAMFISQPTVNRELEQIRVQLARYRRGDI